MTQQQDTTGTSLIIEGIAADARQQAEALLAEGKKMAEERIAFARGKADKITREAEGKARLQADTVRQTVLSGINVALKREKLQAQDGLLKEVLARAGEKIAGMIATPAYRNILAAWITEAAAGLDVPVARVNASAAERKLIDTALLGEAAKNAENICNHPVSLSLADAPPLAGQGVVVTAADGRTAFNNQVATRLRRHESAIRNLVYDTMFSSSNNTGELSEGIEKS
ncbi:MAG: hypothetical protein JW863_17505 [Chitinispirillaceae bacterium]|nr:hypothetical protein [Chitinispirillaceae bacterium]